MCPCCLFLFLEVFEMKNLGYYNGKYDEIENMSIPMLDRVCWFGDGIYDATYAHNHKIFDMDAHLNRFYNSAKLLDIIMPVERPELEALLKELVLKVDDGDQFVYMQVTRGSGLRGHNYSTGDQNKANLWITLTPSPVADTYKPIDVITFEDKRFEYCNCKTLNLIPSCLAATAADRSGCAEAIFHRGDIVTECAHSNVHMIKDGVFITHPTDHYILPGISRVHLIKMCKVAGIPVDERPFTVTEMMDADEVIVSSSSNFCLSAHEIDEKPVGGKAPEILATLRKLLMDEYLTAIGRK